jgi:NinB protein
LPLLAVISRDHAFSRGSLCVSRFRKDDGMIQTYVLLDEPRKRRACNAIMQAQDGSVCKIGEPKRSLDQNAKFHAICTDMAKSGAEWAGKPRTAAEWKVLLVSGHAVATNGASEIVPGLENEFVNIGESTASMSKKRGSSLIEYTIAFCAMRGIGLND